VPVADLIADDAAGDGADGLRDRAIIVVSHRQCTRRWRGVVTDVRHVADDAWRRTVPDTRLHDDERALRVLDDLLRTLMAITRVVVAVVAVAGKGAGADGGG
jgi:hypothetical protein